MADLTVKYFNSGMTGAPQIVNNWGDLVTMLDACLVNGFALKAIDTLTLADGIATATISTVGRSSWIASAARRPIASPSSQVSSPATALSPQVVTHVDGAPVQVQPIWR